MTLKVLSNSKHSIILWYRPWIFIETQLNATHSLPWVGQQPKALLRDCTNPWVQIGLFLTSNMYLVFVRICLYLSEKRQAAQHRFPHSLLSKYGLEVWTPPDSGEDAVLVQAWGSTREQRQMLSIILPWHPLHQVQWCRNVVLIVKSSQESARGFKTDPTWNNVLLRKHRAEKTGACLLLVVRPELWASKCGSQQWEKAKRVSYQAGEIHICAGWHWENNTTLWQKAKWLTWR